MLYGLVRLVMVSQFVKMTKTQALTRVAPGEGLGLYPSKYTSAPLEGKKTIFSEIFVSISTLKTVF